MKDLSNSLAYEASDVAQFRLHAINHYQKHGLTSTLDAFNLKRSTFYDWYHIYKLENKRISALVPKGTAPQHVRRMTTDYRLVEFIKQMRLDHGNVGKNIIKPFLDAYALELGLSKIGLTTIGKIVKRRGFTFEQKVRIKRENRFKKLRTRKSPKVTTPGFIQMDSITVYINLERHLFMSVIDIYTKFAYVEKVKSLSATNAQKVFLNFLRVNPTQVHTVQTDNGSEFLSEFHLELEERNIKHVFIYPRMPRINGCIERFNRTIQEEFILRNDEIYYDEKGFNLKLTKYLQWYNNERPHGSLNYVSPLVFINSGSPKG